MLPPRRRSNRRTECSLSYLQRAALPRWLSERRGFFAPAKEPQPYQVALWCAALAVPISLSIHFSFRACPLRRLPGAFHRPALLQAGEMHSLQLQSEFVRARLQSCRTEAPLSFSPIHARLARDVFA